MDPNENLAHQLRLAKSIIDDEYEVDSADAVDLAELVVALNDWIVAGGFLPAAWKR